MIDTNVVIDIFGSDQRWHEWASDRLAQATETGEAAVSVVVIGELAVRGVAYQQLEQALNDIDLALYDLSARAAHRAGLAQQLYRQRGGSRERLLGNFLIGAHATTLDAVLVTRDSKRYRSYFPELTLITPESHP